MFKNKTEEKKSMSKFKKALFVFVILFLIVVSFFVGAYMSQRSAVIRELTIKEGVYLGEVIGKYSKEKRMLTNDIDFDLFWDVWDTLKKDYVDKGELNEKEMFYGSLKGLVNSLDDPYTVFMDPKKSKEFDEDLAGSFEGIGAEIGIRDDILTIIAPLDGMPAQIAGLKAGDKVLAIDGESTAGITIDEAVKTIRGHKGTEVILMISRKGEDEFKEITIKRGVITVKSIKTELREDKIFVIKISNFNNDTESLFNKAVREVLSNDPKGVILDLRNNPGGYLDTAIEVASEWIDKDIIASEQFGDNSKENYLSRGRSRLKDYQTVVLVNEGSASASEIVAGALQDHGKAKVVGKKTFGKGSVQGLRDFRDGSSVKITVAKWLTPNGLCINDEGISPDVEIEYTVEDFKEDRDTQMNKAIELLGGEFVVYEEKVEE